MSLEMHTASKTRLDIDFAVALPIVERLYRTQGISEGIYRPTATSDDYGGVQSWEVKGHPAFINEKHIALAAIKDDMPNRKPHDRLQIDTFLHGIQLIIYVNDIFTHAKTQNPRYTGVLE